MKNVIADASPVITDALLQAVIEARGIGADGKPKGLSVKTGPGWMVAVKHVPPEKQHRYAQLGLINIMIRLSGEDDDGIRHRLRHNNEALNALFYPWSGYQVSLFDIQKTRLATDDDDNGNNTIAGKGHVSSLWVILRRGLC